MMAGSFKNMGERFIKLGVFKNRQDPRIEDEGTALMALLHSLKIEGLECKIETHITPQNSAQIIANIAWPSVSELKDLQTGRRVDDVIEQVGKR